ncbi:MAG: MFS transporter [Chloroflexi bacterium]|nr:MFS transporter [Chloroflexota bacterium]
MTSATLPPTSATAARPRLMTTLLAAQVCGSTGHSLTLAVGSIVAADLTGSNTLSGIPVAVGALGGALASVPLSWLMARHGRRPGLALGYVLGVVGSVLSMAAVAERSFGLFLVGMFLFGFGQASSLLGRFAAADVSTTDQRGRAIGLIVGGATAGSIIGPNLLTPATAVAERLGLPVVGGPFLIGIVGFGLGALLLQTFLRPDPLTVARELHLADAGTRAAAAASRAARPLGRILRVPRIRIAFGALMTSQLVMIGTTSTAAVYLKDHGHDVGMIGIAVSLHLAGMYMASPFTGWLCDRVGRLTMILSGGMLLIVATVVAGLAPGSNGLLVALMFCLNGVGWNFAFVAGSALLTDALAPQERTSMQGFADLMTGLMGALGSTLGGIMLQSWGFAALNGAGAILILGPLAAVWLGRAALAPQPSERPEAAASSA